MMSWKYSTDMLLQSEIDSALINETVWYIFDLGRHSNEQLWGRADVEPESAYLSIAVETLREVLWENNC